MWNHSIRLSLAVPIFFHIQTTLIFIIYIIIHNIQGAGRKKWQILNLVLSLTHNSHAAQTATSCSTKNLTSIFFTYTKKSMIIREKNKPWNLFISNNPFSPSPPAAAVALASNKSGVDDGDMQIHLPGKSCHIYSMVVLFEWHNMLYIINNEATMMLCQLLALMFAWKKFTVTGWDVLIIIFLFEWLTLIIWYD